MSEEVKQEEPTTQQASVEVVTKEEESTAHFEPVVSSFTARHGALRRNAVEWQELTSVESSSSMMIDMVRSAFAACFLFLFWKV